MAVQKEFLEDNFMRGMRHTNRARILAHVLAPKMRTLFPKLFEAEPTIRALDNQG